ncbi:uncharacterized protein [Centruroides vittatus]|uniref:uncharacterized protein n=1 Tax=Centruroides vittatus TaxID=120091 RepID=UPI003510528A
MLPEEFVLDSMSSIKTLCLSSNMCSVKTEYDTKIVFHCLGRRVNQLKVLHLVGDTICYSSHSELPGIPLRVIKAPESEMYPQIGVKTDNNIKFFNLDEGRLLLVDKLLEIDDDDPIVNCDWNPCDPNNIVTMKSYNECIIWDYMLKSVIRRITSDNVGLPHIVHQPIPRFGNGIMKDVLIHLETMGNVVLSDIRSPRSQKVYNFTDEIILGMEYSGFHSVVFRSRQAVTLIDVRFMKRKFDSYTCQDEITDFSVLPDFADVYISTATGKIIKWLVICNKHYKIKDSHYVHRIHCPPLHSNNIIAAVKSETGYSVNVYKLRETYSYTNKSF